ncbi:Uncharacterized damage-inducible protein DinB (forms a four-helix bundle) [Jatrophihabitans endophyticus]|uniref:Uncharacterized damage-inducible protein DinB (Forms a four-helix bundle) n=1 Tax=Jatrophihabitans endophyticus TaxID=1206085 RepID=A0A1M5C200_9ACTN|nr:DUF664 domain-containing protein [Jatrophihabitans endophyticus]SHF48462.1 Uncharacterized damage-inducible protein DinB (forms a four-helix bundle) [Jatrophihabitans endophyticus]
MTTPRGWVVPTPRPADGPTTGEERPLLVGYLAWQRATLVNICAGLGPGQLALRPVPSSALSLLGLLRHLAKVERIWLRQRVAGEDVPPLFHGTRDATDFDAGTAADAPSAVELFDDECRRADAAVAAVPFEHEITVHGQVMSLRMVYVHLIGEYARHNGHADLLREAIDGVRGR